MAIQFPEVCDRLMVLLALEYNYKTYPFYYHLCKLANIYQISDTRINYDKQSSTFETS